MYLNQVLEDGLEILKLAIVKRIDANGTLHVVSAMKLVVECKDTDWKFPFGLPERFDRLVMLSSLGECFTQHPISFRRELHVVIRYICL